LQKQELILCPAGIPYFSKRFLNLHLMNTINASQKIKVAVPSLVREQLLLDVNDYGLRGIGELCNIILCGYAELRAPEKDSALPDDSIFKNAPPLQFSLHKGNARFRNFADAHALRLAPLCRHYFEEYVNLPRARRELFIKSAEMGCISDAIRNRAAVTLSYHGKQRHCSPCFIAFSKAQARAYLVIYEPGHDKDPLKCFCALRLACVKDVAIGDAGTAFHQNDFALSKRAKELEEHFDPYLCYGEMVKVRLTDEGEKMLARIATNRPETISNEYGVYTFVCSQLLAQRYFGQFLAEAEILEPATLREWFKKKLAESVARYKK